MVNHSMSIIFTNMYIRFPLSVLSLSVEFIITINYKPVSGQVNRWSAIETVELGSIPGRVEPKTIKIGIHCFSYA